MSEEIAPRPRLACSLVEFRVSERSYGISPEESQDKRPGTVARHAVVFRIDLPCQLRSDRTNHSGKYLITNYFRGADAFCQGSTP